MGSAIGRALRREGHAVRAVVTRHNSSARRAAESIGGGAISFTERQLNNLPPDALKSLLDSELILIATPDDVLDSVAQELVGLFGPRSARQTRSQRVALHTSGALTSEVLSPLRAAGFAVGSLHPLVSVAGATDASNVFDGVHFCVEGDSRAVRLARSIVKELGGHSFTIAPQAKALYHAAAAISSGHVVALIDVAIEMFEQCGLSKRLARQIMLPLLNSTITNLAEKTPADALTGPVSRGDVVTVQKHLAAMDEQGLTEAAAVYSALGQRAVRLAKTGKAHSKHLDTIARLLSSTRVGIL